jgi:hypothetical protein
MSKDGIAAIEENGPYIKDYEDDYSTTTIKGRECAFAFYEKNGILKCAFEKAFEDGVIDFPKPISCHLYPIRVSSIVDTDALNYHKWEICKPACSCGEMLKVPVYKFLKEPLERAYGAEWYTELEDTAKAWVLAHKKC